MDSKTYQKLYKIKNKVRLDEKRKEYYLKNREYILKRAKQYRVDNLDNLKNKDCIYYQNNKEKRKKYIREWQKRNFEKTRLYSIKHDGKTLINGASRAVQAVHHAVKIGKLTNLKNEFIKCTDCDDRATQYDHRDYNNPLVVEPICQSCNIKRGPALPCYRIIIKRSHRNNSIGTSKKKGDRNG